MDDSRTAEQKLEAITEAADTVEWRWRLLEHATTLPAQANAMSNLQDAIEDLATYLPGYDLDLGEVVRPED